MIGVRVDLGKNLNIVDRGPIKDPVLAKAIGRGARKHGYDSITTPSVQEGGSINTVVLDPKRAQPLGVVKDGRQ